MDDNPAFYYGFVVDAGLSFGPLLHFVLGLRWRGHRAHGVASHLLAGELPSQLHRRLVPARLVAMLLDLALSLLAVRASVIVETIVVVQELVDDLILMHLLDQFEEASADEVLPSFNAIQRRLQQEEYEVERVLVVAVSSPLLVDHRAHFWGLDFLTRAFNLRLLGRWHDGVGGLPWAAFR